MFLDHSGQQEQPQNPTLTHFKADTVNVLPVYAKGPKQKLATREKKNWKTKSGTQETHLED